MIRNKMVKKDTYFIRSIKILKLYIKSGLLLYLLVQFFFYFGIVSIHVILYNYFENFGNYLIDLDISASLLLMNFYITLYYRSEILRNEEGYEQNPKKFFIIKKKIEKISVLLEISNKHNDNITDIDINTLENYLKEILNSILNMLKDGDSGYNPDDKYYKDYILEFRHTIFSFKQNEKIDSSSYEKIIVNLDYIDNFIYNYLFENIFTYPKLMNNHKKVVLNFYLYVITPMEMFSSVQYLILFIYPISMFILNSNIIIRSFIGEAFDRNKSKYHQNKYNNWLNESLENIDKNKRKFM